MVFNFVCFALVACKLRSATTNRGNITDSPKLNLIIYFLLFILLGANGVLILVTPFTSHIAVSILLILTLAGQGIYIGAVSIFNPQVIGYLRKNARKSTKAKSTQNYKNDENISQ